MSDTRREPIRSPLPDRTAPVALIGAPSPLRSAVAGQLRTATSLLACVDTPDRLGKALSSAASGGNGIAGATILFVTVPRPPGPATRLRHRFRDPALAAGFIQAVTAARQYGAPGS